jgi:transcriptional activator for dhaKLM operon
MRHTDYPYQPEQVLAHWQTFRASVPNPPNHAPTGIDPVVYDSWLRCQPLFIGAGTPLPSAPVAPAFDQTLISTALPHLEDVYQCIDGLSAALLLVSQGGLLLTLRSDPTLTLHLDALGLGAGSCWSEACVGTNALGLSLLTAMPTQVIGAEHALPDLHAFGGSAAPLHNQQGAMVGILGMLTPVEQANPVQLALMMTTAQAISSQLQADLLLEQANQRSRTLESILESVTDGVITWDTDGHVDHFNHMATQILGVGSRPLLGRRIHEVIGFPDHIQGVIAGQREITDVEASLRIIDRFVKCLLNVRVIRNGTGAVMGGIVMLRPVAQVRSLVNQQMNAPATLTVNDFEFASSTMHSLLRQAKIAAKGASPVLLSGEAGVGKTALAQAIHNASPRAGKPLVVLNCSMIPNEFMVEELLGREAQGAQHGRPSKFELADGGTLVLDQIDQLSLEAQRILLQVMNSRSVTRLYAERTTHVNVRILGTTGLDIEAQVALRSFLPQLYYLFNIFHLRLPPLRERREDIPRFARRFLERTTPEGQAAVLDDEATELLQSYPWPGNVRELESVIERAIMQSSDGIIRAGDLPENVRLGHSLNPESALLQPVLSLEAAERDAIMRAGRACGGGISAMATALGIDRTTLWRKLKRYDIQVAIFK